MRKSSLTVAVRRPQRWQPLLVLGGIAALILWISADSPVKLHAQQTQSDYNAKKRSSQLPARPIPGAGTSVDATALAKIIDDEIALKLKQEKLPSSPPCGDSEFIRRVYLDLNGVIPPAERVKAFLESKEPDKREKLIDELLANSRYGKQLSEIWMHQIVSPDLENRLLATENLRKWLEDAFNKNKPWSKIVEELVTANGTMDDNPATLFFITNNGTDKVTGQVSKLFLGVQLQCAQCHNHPFTDWKQDEYWGMAAFFMKVKQDGNAKMVAKNGGTITISEPAGAAAGPFAKKAPAKKKGPPPPEGIKYVPAKFLAGEQPKMAKNAPARPVLAKWLTGANNPFFAKAMVNRLWAHLFGRGFVNPIDDMHEDNPATHLELMLALAEQFKRHDFDIKYLVKAITLSETYQRSSKPIPGNETETELFSRMYIKALTAEQFVDSIISVVGPPGPKANLFAKKKGPDGKKGPLLAPRDQLVKFFNVEDGAEPLEYQDGIPQVLRIMNGPLFNNGGKALMEVVKLKTATEAIDYLYVTALSRHPTIQENTRLTGYVSKQKDKRTGYSDVLWSLLNSSEFKLNH